jgi:hypothetical protein
MKSLNSPLRATHSDIPALFEAIRQPTEPPANPARRVRFHTQSALSVGPLGFEGPAPQYQEDNVANRISKNRHLGTRH